MKHCCDPVGEDGGWVPGRQPAGQGSSAVAWGPELRVNAMLGFAFCR